MKNRKREICTSGSARDEAGQPPHLLGRRQFLHLAAGAAALPAVLRIAWAQTYPTRPIRLVVPLPPGGAFDTLARPWVEQVKPLLSTMVIENIGGGGSSLGAAAVARARPDGYTILLGGTLKASPDTTPEKFRRRLEADVAFWTPVVEALGLKID